MDDIIKKHNQEVVEDESLHAGALDEPTSRSLEAPHIPKLITTSETKKTPMQMIEKLIIRLYVDEGLSIREIARRIGRSYNFIWQRLRLYEKRGLLKLRPKVIPKYQGELVPRKDMERRRIELRHGKYVTVHYIYPTPEMAYIIGFAIGDGTFSHYAVDLYNTEFGFFDEILKRTRNMAARLNVTASYWFYDEEMNEVKTREKAYIWRIKIHSSALSRAVVTPDGLIKRQALNILLRPESKGYTLAGLWDADGTVTPRLDITLYQGEHNRHVLQIIRQKLDARGISTSQIYVSRRKGAKVYFYKRLLTAREDHLRIDVLAEGKQRWIEVVGEKMLHPKKIANLSLANF